MLDLLRPQALPLAEVDLAQGGHRFGLDAGGEGADGLRGLERALKVAGVEAGKLAPGQARAQELGLSEPLRRKRRVELALDAVLAVPRRLAVAHEHEARGGRTSG